jgi:glucose/arabinose dehydrogenase
MARQRLIPALLALLALAIVPAGARAATGTERLPDLDEEAPSQLGVAVDGHHRHPHYVLGFRSASRNVGAGPLIIDGHRRPGNPTMTADQLIDRDGAPPEVVHRVARMRYVRAPDHQHWHVLGYERYELRRAGSNHVMVRDRKSGFCLGDRYQVANLALPAAVAAPVYTSRCGLRQPHRLHVREGISVGWGDDYSAYLEYQDLALNGLPDGRYVLVHRVNLDHRIRESSYANNAASLLLDIRWKKGLPYVRILRACQTTARCDRAPAAAAARAPAVGPLRRTNTCGCVCHCDEPRVRTFATGLDIPWDIAFMPDGRALVTERPGRVRLIEAGGKVKPRPVARIAVSLVGEGGLLGLVLDPQFRRNHFVYLYYTIAAGMRLERWRWTGTRLVRDASLVDGIASGQVHDSGRIEFGPDRRLYVATGDAGIPRLAQDPRALNGKLLALTPRQYHGPGHARPAVVAMGLRNSQGFDWQPGTGALIANDHGPSGFDGPECCDEVDRIVQGGNYGWPNVIGLDTGNGAYRPPLRFYQAPIAPSGATFVTQRGTKWTGDYILAALKGTELRRLVIRHGRVVADRALLRGRYGRLRTVTEGPHGCLYVLTSNRDGRGTPRPGDDRVLCVQPPRA